MRFRMIYSISPLTEYVFANNSNFRIARVVRAGVDKRDETSPFARLRASRSAGSPDANFSLVLVFRPQRAAL